MDRRALTDFLARYEGVDVPDWETGADLSRMGVESMAREINHRDLRAAIVGALRSRGVWWADDTDGPADAVLAIVMPDAVAEPQ